MTRPLMNSMGLTTAVCLAVLSALLLSGSAGAISKGSRLSDAPLDLIPVVSEGLQSPLFLTHAGDGTAQLFVVEQPGTIRIIDQGILEEIPFLDIRNRVLSGGERGLLGLAFHPNHRKNGRFFVNYTRRDDGATVLAEYRRQGLGLQASAEERTLMVVPQPYANHNGGMIAFGPDGYLYIGLGDGGSGGDPQNFAQNTQELLGKILRIDVDRDHPYAIPPDNPFVTGGGRPEVFALGIRNPWRFSFDRHGGILWLADVGQNKWEEVDLVIADGNYGWRVMEGTHCFNPDHACSPEGLIFPIAEYGHEHGRCSVTGGYVYRGEAVPALRGTYLFGDYCSGELFAISAEANKRHSNEPQVLLQTGLRISSFGEDETGELYIVDHKGGLYQVAPSGVADSP